MRGMEITTLANPHPRAELQRLRSYGFGFETDCAVVSPSSEGLQSLTPPRW